MLRPAVLLITRLLPEPERLADMGIRIAIILAFAFLAQWLVYVAITRMERFMIGAGHGAVPVEARALRSTTLRDFHGYVHVVPNGELKSVTNRSRGWTRVAIDVPVATDQNLEHALDVCRRVVEAMNLDPEWRPRLLDPVEVWG